MSELRDLVEEVETLIRTARGALGAVMDPSDPEVAGNGDAADFRAVAGAASLAADEARDDLDQALLRIERARFDGVVPR